MRAETYSSGFAITACITFLVAYIYCIASYGLLLGVGLGWLPSMIVATFVGALWPVMALVVGIVVIWLGYLITTAEISTSVEENLEWLAVVGLIIALVGVIMLVDIVARKVRSRAASGLSTVLAASPEPAPEEPVSSDHMLVRSITSFRNDMDVARARMREEVVAGTADANRRIERANKFLVDTGVHHAVLTILKE
jgi:hypothetical protein